MKRIVICVVAFLCICCDDKIEIESMISGHLIEGTTGESLPNVRVTLYDNSRIYSVVFSDPNGRFSMTTPPLKKSSRYCLSFQWNPEFPAKVLALNNITEYLNLHDYVVYDKSNPHAYNVYDGYMIHETLSGTYTFAEAKEACKALRDGYDDWTLPEADYLDRLSDCGNLIRQVVEPGWYWSSWILFGETYMGVNILNDECAYTTDHKKKLKVLPVRLIK